MCALSLEEESYYDSTEAVYTYDALRTAMSNSSGTFYFAKDALGSITDIVDENGIKVQHHVYSSFGKLEKITDGAGADITATPLIEPYFTYTGIELDQESGLYYYRARYYDPGTGRFLQEDPDSREISLPATFASKYIYVANNSQNFVDPSGKFYYFFKDQPFEKVIELAFNLRKSSIG
jgi:RHS repeat-associated protein